MRAVVQRVQRASVDVDGATVSSIGPGLMVLVGIHAEDTPEDARWLAGKVLKARCFENAEGKMWAETVCAAGGQVLFVSQFTLHGSFARGNKPDLHAAMPPGPAKALYDEFLRLARSAWPEALGEECFFDGVFGASMAVSLVNDGPVTFVLDSRERKA